MIRMEVASSRSDYLPTLPAAKTSKLSLLVKHHILAIDEATQQQQQQQEYMHLYSAVWLIKRENCFYCHINDDLI